MAESLLIAALQTKAQELQRQVVTYEDALEKVRHDLAIIAGPIRICERGENVPEHFAPHLSLRNFFSRGEMLALSLKALEDAPEGLSNRDLAVILLRDKGFDHNDPVLRRTLTHKLAADLGKQARRGKVAKAGMREGSAVYRHPCTDNASRNRADDSSPAKTERKRTKVILYA